MKKIYFLLVFIESLFFFNNANSANFGWTQRANFGGVGRHRCVAFTIGNRGYLGTGHYNAQG